MILITGGTGLLGTHLLIKLTSENQSIRAIYRNKEKIAQVKKVFDYYLKDKSEKQFNSIEWLNADILDIVSLDMAFKDVKQVYHCAALVSFDPNDFYNLFKINREGTANVVNLCLANKVEQLMHVSSTAALGKSKDEPIDENTPWENDRKNSGYSLSKYSAEKEVWRGIEEGLNAVIVNPSVMFGAGNWNESSLTIFNTIKKGMKFYTNGANGFVDARDVANIMWLLMESKVNKERFVVVAETVTFKALFDQIAFSLKVKPPSINVKPWLMQVTWRVAKIISLFSRKKPVITKYTAQTAFNKIDYDATKIKSLLQYNFIKMVDTIENTVAGEIK